MAKANIHMFFALYSFVQVSVAGFCVLRCSLLLCHQLSVGNLWGADGRAVENCCYASH